VDKGGWNLESARDAFFYRYFKHIEKKLIQKSDHMVVLTQAVIPELRKLGLRDLDKVNIIPCCADFEHFKMKSLADKKILRQKHLIPEDALVIGYLGSIGKMYMTDEFFRFLIANSAKKPNTYALIVTQDIGLAREEMQKYLSPHLQEKVLIQSASRSEIPCLIALMDVMLSFIQPSYARLATSPTKIAESLACGVPVIANAGIGDVTEILTDLKLGKIVYDFSQAVDIQEMISQMDAWEVRNKARTVFDLENAHHSYHEAYKKLERESIC
jgi:glycosyltransferase involved in cell wall biosynthesis